MKWTTFFVGAISLGLILSMKVSADMAVPSSTDVLSESSPGVPEIFSWPVSKTISGRKTAVVSRYGKRQSPSGPYPNAGATEMHEGIDFGVPVNSAVRAAQTGKVIFAGFSSMYVSRMDKTQKSRLVIILHADGRSTRYVHLDRLRVAPGNRVEAGQVIGFSSDSDEWTEPVLHFEIRGSQGQPLNPWPLLTADENSEAVSSRDEP